MANNSLTSDLDSFDNPTPDNKPLLTLPNATLTGDLDKHDQLNWSDIPRNATVKFGTGLVDSVLNTPSNLYNLGKAAYGTAAIASGHPELAPNVSAPPNYATNLANRIGAIKQGTMTPAQSIAESGLEGAESAFLNPMGGIRRIIGNIISGGALGAGSEAVSQATDNPALGAVAGIAAPKLTNLAANATGNLSSHLLGMTTGVGAENIKQGYQAGKTNDPAFWDNLTGSVPMTQVLDDAKMGLNNMARQKQAEYRSGMVDIKNDQSTLSFDDIYKAIDDANNAVAFKGQIKNPKAADVVGQITDQVHKWSALDPNEFHTPEGLDALKQSIGGIIETVPYENKTAQMVGNNIYNAVKNTIQNQAPTYSNVMKNYSDASDQIKELERAFSLNDKASADTAMRKLQSLSRNNVNTNYGNRLDLAKQLQDQGGVSILPALAGQSMSSWTPRGIPQQGAALLNMGIVPSLVDPKTLLALPFQSPKAVGAMTYGAGKAAGLLDKYIPKGGTPEQTANWLWMSNKANNVPQ